MTGLNEPPPEPSGPMSDPSQQEDEWRRLALELGLEPPEPAARPAPAKPAPPPQARSERAAEEPPARPQRRRAEPEPEEEPVDAPFFEPAEEAEAESQAFEPHELLCRRLVERWEAQHGARAFQPPSKPPVVAAKPQSAGRALRSPSLGASRPIATKNRPVEAGSGPAM